MRKLLLATLPAVVAFGFAADGALAQTGRWGGTPACKILSVEVTAEMQLVITGRGLTERRRFRVVAPQVWFGGQSVPVSSDPAPTSTQIVVDVSGAVEGLEAPKSFLLEVERSRWGGDCPGHLVTVIPVPKKIVFVTSASYDGMFDPDPSVPDALNAAQCGTGLAGADCLCGLHAAQAGLPGEYKAWLSDAAESPDTRFNKASAPYVLPDGKTVVAASYAELVSQPLSHAIDQTETGEELASASDVWANTGADGKMVNKEHSCRADWSDLSIESYGGIGSSGDTAATWTNADYQDCGFMYARLYCFQQ